MGSVHYGPQLGRLKKRREFLHVRGGIRWSGPAFLLEAKATGAVAINGLRSAGAKQPFIRGASSVIDLDQNARFGFTVTSKLGSSVVRNRIRRRLSHALRAARLAVPAVALDYVVVARPAALDRRFDDLVADFRAALCAVRSRTDGCDQKSAKRAANRPPKSPDKARRT